MVQLGTFKKYIIIILLLILCLFVELEVPLKEWKLQARQFTVDIKFEGWIAKMEPKFLLSDEQVKFVCFIPLSSF